MKNHTLKKDGRHQYVTRKGIKIISRSRSDLLVIHEIFILECYDQAIKNNSTIIDIGANIGIFDLRVNEIAKGCKIYAFEPDKENIGRIKEHIKVNKLENDVFVFNEAVGGRKEQKKLFLQEKSAGHSFHIHTEKGNYETVNCVTLENIFKDNNISFCDLLKIDVEGNEYDIFYNTPDNIFSRIGEIRMEYHNLDEKNNNGKALMKFFKSKKFTIIEKDNSDNQMVGLVFCKNSLTHHI